MRSQKLCCGNWYDYPKYYDIAFQGDTALEADFVLAGCQRFSGCAPRRVFEPGCGTGRLLAELGRRGLAGLGIDCNPHSVDFARQRLRSEKLGRRMRVEVADMTGYQTVERFDAAYCFCNTFRSLLTEQAARSHMESVAAVLRPGGLYFLGLHLLPPDADWQAHERWAEERDGCKVGVTLRVLQSAPGKRLETLRFSLLVREGTETIRIRSDEQLRTYNAAQFKQLLKATKAFELVAVRDFWYDLDFPVALDDNLADTVVILKKR